MVRRLPAKEQPLLQGHVPITALLSTIPRQRDFSFLAIVRHSQNQQKQNRESNRVNTPQLPRHFTIFAQLTAKRTALISQLSSFPHFILFILCPYLRSDRSSADICLNPLRAP